MPARARHLLPVLGSVAAALVLTTVRGPDEVAAAASTPPRLPASSGEELWLRDCAICHAEDGSGSERGPTLHGAGAAGVDFMVSTGRMPIQDPSIESFRGRVNYDPAEIEALVEYAGTLLEGPQVPEVSTEGADVAKGGEAYRNHCASCHQMAGQGGILPNGRDVPPLGPSTDVQVVEALRFGPNTMPPFPEALIDERSATEIAAYVQEIDDPEDRGGWPLGHWGPVPEGAAALVFGLVPVVLVARWLGDRNPPRAQEDEIR